MSDLEERLARLLLAHIDDSPCRFDHHGGCQEHGFLDLDPDLGEICPTREARNLLTELGIDWKR